MSLTWMFLILTLLGGELGLLMLCHEMKQHSQTQRHLDACSGRLARAARKTLRKVEERNQEIAKLRMAMSLALEPRVFKTLQQLLRASVLRQEIELKKWKALQISWQLPQGQCSKKSFLHSLPVFRPPPDIKGPQTLEWKGSRDFWIETSHQMITSRASIIWREAEKRWIIAWTVSKSGGRPWWRP